MAGVSGCSGPVDLPGTVQALKDPLVQLLPDPGLLPFPQPSPARHTGPIPELHWQITPRDPRVQHEQDPVQSSPIIQTLAARITPTPDDHRQQRLYLSPQAVIDLKP
jgi:hypothetical protein